MATEGTTDIAQFYHRCQTECAAPADADTVVRALLSAAEYPSFLQLMTAYQQVPPPCNRHQPHKCFRGNRYTFCAGCY